MKSASTHVSVSSAEIVRQFGRWQDHAAHQPVFVTHHGRVRIVLVSAVHYQALASTGAANDAKSADRAPAEIADQLMEHLTQGFIAFRADMTISAINNAACYYLKTQRDAVLGRRLEERLAGIEETLGHVSLTRAAASGSISMFEMPSFAYPGRWLLAQTFPFDDGAACLFRDITDELEARRQADAKVATMAAIAAHGGVGRARLSVRGTLSEVDVAFARFGGFTPDALLRARLTDMLVTRHRAAAAETIEAVLDGDGARALDVQVLTRAGTERDVRIGIAPLRTQDGAAGAVAVMSDLPGCEASTR